MKPAIEIKNLGKEYKLTEALPYLALRDQLALSVKRLFSPVGVKKEKFWALKDINLSIEPGERVGIIGRNGAGKSTLLKIISRITPPTTGEAFIRGRVGSLLEVGTGFHPELTGRENIYLNGSILGLKKAEINRQLDTIIDFSGVEKFIDTPLKHYSSGMQLRLAFSVAAHLEPEILLIDEVLAVGDMEFQKKCLGKMEEVSRKDGRTILFVSHNLKAINDICQKAVMLDKGKILMYDTVEKTTNKYICTIQSGQNIRPLNSDQIKRIHISSINLVNSRRLTQYIFKEDENIGIEFTIRNKDWKRPFTIGIGLNTGLKGRILISNRLSEAISENSSKTVIAWLPAHYLTPNSFSIDISLLDSSNEILDLTTDAISFEIAIANTKFEGIGYDYGIISKDLIWENAD
ncbi:MAG: ABC transporter ATP-binding protein [Sphingobacteriales bacterium]|nr:ABC transporter ATP-binding protein [Sphingobacteriales bacterium]